jgi:uncharacterized membrane-anchored protein YhcB (DUF1043 family)
MRLIRMTTRKWMVVVMIVGLLMGVIVSGVRLKQRRSHFRSRVQYHEQRSAFLPKLEKYQRGIAEDFPRLIATFAWRQRRGEPVGSQLEGMKERLDRARKDLELLSARSLNMLGYPLNTSMPLARDHDPIIPPYHRREPARPRPRRSGRPLRPPSRRRDDLPSRPR